MRKARTLCCAPPVSSAARPFFGGPVLGALFSTVPNEAKQVTCVAVPPTILLHEADQTCVAVPHTVVLHEGNQACAAVPHTILLHQAHLPSYLTI